MVRKNFGMVKTYLSCNHKRISSMKRVFPLVSKSMSFERPRVHHTKGSTLSNILWTDPIVSCTSHLFYFSFFENNSVIST